MLFASEKLETRSNRREYTSGWDLLMEICLLRSTAKSVSNDHKNEFTVTLSHNDMPL